jgi:hypothetical protein
MCSCQSETSWRAKSRAEKITWTSPGPTSASPLAMRSGVAPPKSSFEITTVSPVQARARSATVCHSPLNALARWVPQPTLRKSCIDRNDWPWSSYGYSTPAAASCSLFWRRTCCR